MRVAPGGILLGSMDPSCGRCMQLLIQGCISRRFSHSHFQHAISAQVSYLSKLVARHDCRSQSPGKNVRLRQHACQVETFDKLVDQVYIIMAGFNKQGLQKV